MRHVSLTRLTRRLMGLAWRYRRPCLAVLVLNGLTVTVGVVGLGMTGMGIDYIRHQVDSDAAALRWPWGLSPPDGNSPIAVVAAIATGILAMSLLAAALKYATAVVSAGLSQELLVQLRSDVYDKLQRLSFDFYDANPGSSLINRAAGDVQSVRTFVDGVVVKVLVVLLTLAVYLCYMLSVHVRLTLVCVITSPLLWYLSVRFSRRVQPEYRRASETVDDLVLTLVENVEGQHVIKGFARQPEEIEKFRQANQRVHAQKGSIFWRLSLYQPATGLLTQLNMLILLGYGGFLVIRGQLQLGVGLFVFANLLHEFANQVGQITNIANTIQTSLTGAVRVFEILDAPLEIQSPPSPRSLPRRGCHSEAVTGREAGPGRSGRSVRFEDVEFAYRGQDEGTAREPVLRQISFAVAPGEHWGVVGETGAGKTTLLSLLSRFYDVSAGSVSVDGIDVRQLALDELRRNIGIVFQESFLFSHTVAANIAFGKLDATPREIRRAARLAAADEFIQALPDGYETVVGENGANLSGGQRQRLAIARALLLDPPILLLDDATASVDSETEHEIHTALERAARGRTTIVVSNRMSMLRRMDQILVLEQGRIIEQGRPAELLCVPGVFRQLAELQYADEMDDVLSAVAEGS